MTQPPTSVLQLDPGDNVAVSLGDLGAGQTITPSGAEPVTAAVEITRGHKIAIRPIEAGAPVHKYGQAIGQALTAVAAGDHVHTHNLGMAEIEREYEFGTARTTAPPPPGDRPTFLGYRRADGRVGTRNYVGIAHLGQLLGLDGPDDRRPVPRLRARWTSPERRRRDRADPRLRLRPGRRPARAAQMLLRTLRGYAAHPNFARPAGARARLRDDRPSTRRSPSWSSPSDTLVERHDHPGAGGVRATVRAGVGRIQRDAAGDRAAASGTAVDAAPS